MKQFAFATFMMVMFSTSIATAECDVIEYAQLKDMNARNLKIKLNYYESSYKTYMNEALSQARKGRTVAATRFNQIAIQCSNEAEKARQIMEAKGISTSSESEPSQRQGGSVYRSVDKDGTMVFSDNPR